jgi:hypothetical protein
MTLHIKLDDNNNVLQVWDTPPPEGEAGWHDAIEVRPVLVPHRQGYTAHRFDLDKRPIEIIWDIYEILVEDRKSSMVSQEKSKFQQVVQQQAQLQINDNPAEQYEPTVVEDAKTALLLKTTAIEAATTHDELDALL